MIWSGDAAAHEFDARRRMISKNFHHVLRVSERQSLVGPPESMREHVVAACKAMKVGDWHACYNFIINEKMNAKVSPHHAIASERLSGFRCHFTTCTLLLFSCHGVYVLPVLLSSF